MPPAIRYHMPVFALLLLAVLTSMAAAQNVRRARPQMPTEKIKTAGTIKAVGRGALQIVGGKGEQWIVQIPKKPAAVKFYASADPSWLRAGMFIRFRGQFDARGEVQAEVDQLTVFTPQETSKFGVFPEAGLANNRLFVDDADRKSPTAQVRWFQVAGQLVALRRGKMMVRTGAANVTTELAAKAKVSVEVADYRLARPGDTVQIQGWYYPMQESHIYANSLTINAAKPLGVPTQLAPKKAAPKNLE